MGEKEFVLEKKLSPINVWSLAFGCIIGFGCFILPGNSFLANAGTLGTAIAIFLGAAVMMIIALNYDYMIRLFPVAGGEFTYTEKAFGPRHGFWCAWFLGLSYGTLVPMNATALALIGRNLLNGVFKFGFHYVLAGYDVYLGEVILAIFAILLFGFLSIRGVRTVGIFQVILALSLIGGVLVILFAAIFSPKATLSNLTPVFSPTKNKWNGIACVMAIAPFLFVGFDTVPQSAEEFNFSTRKTRIIMCISIAFGALVYVLVNLITAAVVPEGYGSWTDYIANVENLTGIQSLPTFNAAKELLGNWGLLCIGIAVLGATLSGIVGFYMATTRLLYSMARENVLPRSFGMLHSKYKTPYVAILFVLGLAIIAPLFGRVVLGWLVDMSSLGAAIGYGYTSLAALKYAREQHNKFFVCTGVLGVLLSLGFAVLLLVPIPGLGCSLGKESQICLVIWILLGICFYLISKKRRLNHSIVAETKETE